MLQKMGAKLKEISTKSEETTKTQVLKLCSSLCLRAETA